MLVRARRWLRNGAFTIVVVLATVLCVRACDSQRGAPLEPWHTHVPEELSSEKLLHSSWADYIAAEDALFREVQAEVVDRLPAEDRVPANRYFADSPVNPARFSRDWNRSYVMEPTGPPQGAVVLLHGLTDSPYSLRHIAMAYQARGWVAVAIRLPGHGTVPAGLTKATWEDWLSATKLAVREAYRRAGPSGRVQLVGFSNGGALAMKYALDALSDDALPRPERIVLLSPMVGVTDLARFAGVLGWPSIFPAFAKAAWLDIVPEFNPFKYNSFPVNAARQSSIFSRQLQQQLGRMAREGTLTRLPPVLTFQSALDYTVSTRAVVNALYEVLPANGSELVIFDLNHSAHLSPLLRRSGVMLADQLLPQPPRRYATVVISNARGNGSTVQAISTPAGALVSSAQALSAEYPGDVFSLSHVAIPFPPSDALYGSQPLDGENFGLNLGAMSARGERGALIMSLDSLIRMSSNPFYAYMEERITQGIGGVRPAPRPASP